VLGAAPSASSASTSAGGSSSNSVSGGAKPKLCAVKVIRAIRRYSESARIEVDIITKINARDTDGSSHNVRMLDWFEYDGHVCLVFEQLGRSLYSFLKANAYKPYPLRCIADFAAQLVDALHFLHVTMGLVHTDLKPENILLVHSAYDVDSQTGHRVPVDTRIKVRAPVLCCLAPSPPDVSFSVESPRELFLFAHIFFCFLVLFFVCTSILL
jgi:serine/threonine protein kinase